MVYWNAGVLTLSQVPEKIELADYNMEGPKRRLENYVEEFRLACIRIHPSKKIELKEEPYASYIDGFLGLGWEHDMSMRISSNLPLERK